MDKISRENKFCILMGDFNINWLNYESHTPTDEFISNLGVFCFQPHIIQPTRITEHSDRKQFVSIGNSVSEYKPTTCGVPQGSVLDLCSFYYILMILIIVHPILISIFMLMIPIYFVLIKAFRDNFK